MLRKRQLAKLVFVYFTAFVVGPSLYNIEAGQATEEPEKISCTRKSKNDLLQLELNAKDIRLITKMKRILQSKIREKRVVGDGASARVVYRFAHGEFSFHDEYGCISAVKLTHRKFRQLRDIQCVHVGVPACPVQ